MSQQQIGVRLRQRRRELEMSISNLSLFSNVNRNLIGQIERGMIPCSSEPIERLAAALGVSSEELTERE
jgi:transcriptional regulator with XRE-family HTH domain